MKGGLEPRVEHERQTDHCGPLAVVTLAVDKVQEHVVAVYFFYRWQQRLCRHFAQCRNTNYDMGTGSSLCKLQSRLVLVWPDSDTIYEVGVSSWLHPDTNHGMGIVPPLHHLRGVFWFIALWLGSLPPAAYVLQIMFLL